MRKMNLKSMFLSLFVILLMVSAGVAAAPHIIEDDPSSITGTLEFWSAFGPTQGMGDLVAEFNRIYPNVKVNITQYSNTSDGNVGVDTALMAGGQIDVILNFGVANLQRRATTNQFKQLDELLEKDGFDLVEEWGTDVFKFDGKTYSIPMGGLSHYVAINLDAWKEAGFDELPTEWTWDEYIEASRKMTTKDRFGGTDYHTVNYAMYPVHQVLGRDVVFNDEGLSNFDNPLFRKALEQKYKAEVEEKIWFPVSRYRAESIQTQIPLLTGEAASGITMNLARFIRDTDTYPIDFRFGFAPYPTMEPGQVNYMSGVSTFSHVAISADTKYPEAAWAFAKFFATHGGIYLAVAGHMPTWTGTDISKAVDLIFGPEEEAEKLVDLESFRRVVFNMDAPAYEEVEITALAEVLSISSEVYLRCFNGEISIDDALLEMKTRADEAILRVR